MASLSAPRLDPAPFAPPAAPAEDGALVAQAQAGDRAAFALLYDRYVGSIYRFCYRRLGGKEDAEDATSSIFINALAALPTYCMDRGSFRSWLFAIAHHALIDQARARRPTADLDAVDREVSGDPTPDAALQRMEAAHAMRELLATLSPLQAHLIEFRLAGLTWTEIAVVLGGNPTALRVAHHRALARLRRRLEPDREDIDG
jgi:RNA polymerase sigma-70 factor, ECF subfamily